MNIGRREDRRGGLGDDERQLHAPQFLVEGRAHEPGLDVGLQRGGGLGGHPYPLGIQHLRIHVGRLVRVSCAVAQRRGVQQLEQHEVEVAAVDDQGHSASPLPLGGTGMIPARERGRRAARTR